MKEIEKSVETAKLKISDLESSIKRSKYQIEQIEKSMEDTKENHEEDHWNRYLESLPVFLDVRRFAKEIGVSEPTAYKFIQSKKIRFFRVGTQIRIPREAMRELAMGCTIDGEIDEALLSKYDI